MEQCVVENCYLCTDDINTCQHCNDSYQLEYNVCVEINPEQQKIDVIIGIVMGIVFIGFIVGMLIYAILNKIKNDKKANRERQPLLENDHDNIEAVDEQIATKKSSNKA
ncbi:hypothetical protein SS50377_22594 [Spironucleus salmonicida]|uniref:Cysteine-rich membrane protein 2 n=1 Tax=Spironucleus salmonicida TaxID=348837 RepID=V6LBU2_9EUKA|nr:hypothetical protein SS50377_22594 [Spironucleus salmonicida]|eukprot:EST41917.1 Hypothetical protein SS50377_18221 [Spironucleus salmonicida]